MDMEEVEEEGDEVEEEEEKEEEEAEEAVEAASSALSMYLSSCKLIGKLTCFASLLRCPVLSYSNLFKCRQSKLGASEIFSPFVTILLSLHFPQSTRFSGDNTSTSVNAFNAPSRDAMLGSDISKLKSMYLSRVVLTPPQVLQVTLLSRLPSNSSPTPPILWSSDTVNPSSTALRNS